MSELTIAQVLSHYGAKSIPNGVGWKPIRCPFHDDSHASASVNREMNVFRCHTCGVRGNPAQIIAKRENLKGDEVGDFAKSVFGTSCEGVSRSVSRSKKRRPLGRERWRRILD